MDVSPVKSLPVGYRFRPTDEELIDHYLRLKINGSENEVSIIREVDVCKKEPWDLPDLSVVESIDNDWFFFCPKDRKYQSGQRLNRATAAGYWKATGKDRMIKKSGKEKSVIGRKKTLVFYAGRAPKGERTNWVIHEYCATDKALDGTHPGQNPFVLCRLFKKQDGRIGEHVESSNCDEVDSSTASPSVVKSSAKDTQSEPVTPISVGQPEVPPSTIASVKPENMERTSLHPPTLLDWQSTNCNTDDADDHGIDMEPILADPELENFLRDFYDSMPDSEKFSPLHSEMQSELESSYVHSGNGGFGIDPNGMQDQYDTINNIEMIEFLDSIIVDSDEKIYGDFSEVAPTVSIESPKYINSLEWVISNKESGSCSSESESEGEVAQAQGPDTGFIQEYMENMKRSVPVAFEEASRAYIPTVMSHDEQQNNFCQINNGLENNIVALGGDNDFGTGIKIRARQQGYTQAQPIVTQGTAGKRIRMMVSLQIGPVCCIPTKDLSPTKENVDIQPTHNEVEKTNEGTSVISLAAEGTLDISSTEGGVDQETGTALDAGSSDETSCLTTEKSDTEEGEVDQEEPIMALSHGISDETTNTEGESVREPSLNFKVKGNLPVKSPQKVGFLFSKTSRAFSSIPYMPMLQVALGLTVVVLGVLACSVF